MKDKLEAAKKINDILLANRTLDVCNDFDDLGWTKLKKEDYSVEEIAIDVVPIIKILNISLLSSVCHILDNYLERKELSDLIQAKYKGGDSEFFSILTHNSKKILMTLLEQIS